jgi:hypothetical protein
MPVTHVLQANFSQSLGKGLPTIPGLRSLCYFGTANDGNNGNRVPGGAAPINIGTPVYATNYLSATGYNGSASNGLDLNVTRTAAVLASGWTWCAVSRCTPGGAFSGMIIEDGAGAGPPLLGSFNGMAMQNSASFNTYLHAGGTSIRGTLVLTGKNAGSWHFYALTYSGGALGSYVFSEYTDIPSGAPPVTYQGVVTMLASNNSPAICNVVPNGPNTFTVLTDCAFAMVAQGAMLQADIAGLAAAVRPWLARRGIVA